MKLSALSEIRYAFREMAKRNHPDVGGSEAFMRELLAAQQEAKDWLAAQNNR